MTSSTCPTVLKVFTVTANAVRSSSTVLEMLVLYMHDWESIPMLSRYSDTEQNYKSYNSQKATEQPCETSLNEVFRSILVQNRQSL